ncbi:MAG: hemerythrin family protein [Betaproteobacteria bacterium]|nr:hemerythrin family protein [Betaproteobacteria bacterium]
MEKQTRRWIKWDDMLELGHAGMDADHKRLVDLVNQLADCAVGDTGGEAYGELLDRLFAEARSHFEHEERLMARYGYPHTEEHTAEHVKLIETALEYKTRFGASVQPSVSLLYFFEQWLTRHIMSSDRELAAFVIAAANK